MATLPALLTVEEFERLPENAEVKRELLEGELYEVSSGGRQHENIKANLTAYLNEFLRSRKVLRVFPECRFRLGPGTEIQPDISVMRSDRVKWEPATQYYDEAPELAVEIVSSESAAKLEKKVKALHRAGTKSVWVVHPELRFVRVHAAGANPRDFEESDLLEDAIIPGFSVRVAELFE